MADISNLTGLEKPLTKLIETVSEGLGEVGNAVFKFDSKKIQRVGEAEALREKELIVKRAEAHAQADELKKRAEARFNLEQYNKQINLENIISKSADLLINGTVSTQPVDKDWATRFLNVAQDISDQEIQEILSKILADEVKQPTTYSKRVLDVIKNVSKEELINFRKVIPYVNNKGSIFIGGHGKAAFFEQIDLDFQAYIDLCDAGLISTLDSLALHFYAEDEIFIGPNKIHIVVRMSPTLDIRLSVVSLSIAGAHIANLLNVDIEDKDKMDTYINSVLKELREKGADAKVVLN
jgi:hypothetical protein